MYAEPGANQKGWASAVSDRRFWRTVTPQSLRRRYECVDAHDEKWKSRHRVKLKLHSPDLLYTKELNNKSNECVELGFRLAVDLQRRSQSQAS